MTETLQAPIQELTTGFTFAGRYQVIEELGHGGMGKIYKVFDTKIREKIALKLIKPEIASDRETVERFSNEIRLARRIGHRNVCRMFDMGEAEGSHFITMEYVHGEDLKSMIRMSGSLSVGMLLSVGKQVCDGLAEAHSLGVVHRDLKPQNIMIDKNGNAKIMDFGIARSVREKGITGPSVMIGTPEYMSPEQAEAKDVDLRSDIYSLGVILYEMATSHVPFMGETALSIAMKHKGEAPKDPRKLNPGIPAVLSRVILKCLEKDKAKRYQTAADVHAELDRIEKGLPTTERFVPERKPTTSRQITVQLSPKKLFIPVSLALVIVAAAFLLWKILPHRQVPLAVSDRPSLAILYFENISADPSLDDWKTGLTELLITDLSQSRYLNVLGSDRIYGLLKRLGLDQARKYTSDDLQKVAEEGRVNYTGSGSIMKAGENIIITFALRKPRTGEAILPHKLECKGEGEIASKIDELTRLIKADLHLTSAQISADPDQKLGKITTSSPEAYRFFIEAAKLNAQGDFSQSVEILKKAVALDPAFAMAWRSMAVCYANMGNAAEFDRLIRKALEFSDRVSEKELLEIRGLAERNIDKRIEILNKLVELYPDAPTGHQRLATTYLNLEDWGRAQEQLEWGFRIDKDSPILVSNLTELYLARGMVDQAVKTLEDFLRDHEDNPFLRYDLAYAYLAAGESGRARAEAEKSYALSPVDPASIAALGDVALCGGDLKTAEETYRKLLKPEDPVSLILGWQRLSYLDLLMGKFRLAEDDLRQALQAAQASGSRYDEVVVRTGLSYVKFGLRRAAASLDEAGAALEVAADLDTTEGSLLHFVQHWKLWPLLMKGLSYLQMDSFDNASKIAEEIGAMDLYPPERRWHRYLTGLIELEKKNGAKALEDLKQALSLEPHEWLVEASNGAFILEALGRAYLQSGDLENARKNYEEIARLATGRIRYGDIYARSLYQLGKIAESQKDSVRARENYRKFLDLWKDADPGLPEVEDAKKRLAALGS